MGRALPKREKSIEKIRLLRCLSGVLICIILEEGLEEIFESRALAALRGSNQDRFSTKLRARAKLAIAQTCCPRFPLRLALSLCGGDKGRSLSKITPPKVQYLDNQQNHNL
jgi:hypothetical protein